MSPSASTRPSCSTVTRLAMDRTNSISCSTTTTECSPSSDNRSWGGTLNLLRGHASDRLVDQEQFWVLHQQHAYLKPLLLAMGKYTCLAPLLRCEVDDIENLVDSLVLRG